MIPCATEGSVSSPTLPPTLVGEKIKASELIQLSVEDLATAEATEISKSHALAMIEQFQDNIEMLDDNDTFLQ